MHVSSLSYDPAGRPVTWAWALCENPVTSTAEGCIDQIAMQTRATGMSPVLEMGLGVDQFDAQVPADTIDSLPEAARGGASVGVLSAACPGTLTLEAGYASLPFKCAEADTGRELTLDEFVVGVKRIVVREQDRNQNPSISGITFDGQDWAEGDLKEVANSCSRTDNDFGSCDEKLDHRIATRVTPDSFEHGKTELGEDFDEQVVVQYYATEGIFESDVRIAENPETKWVARKQSRGRDLTFWFVARDSRGGASWTTRQAHVD